MQLGVLRTICAFTALVLMSACTGDVCVDFSPNATVIDVLHDEQNDRIFINVLHSLSYCTGTDEKSYSVEQIEIDLDAAQVTFKQRYSDDKKLYALPETCCYLLRDGRFSGGGQCVDCELILRTQDGRTALHFVTGTDWAVPISLSVSRDGTDLLGVEIGPAVSQRL